MKVLNQKSILLILVMLFVLAGFGCSSSNGDGDDDGDAVNDDDDFSTTDDDDDSQQQDDDHTDDDDDDTIPYEPPDGMEIVFYDVGQGDAALVRFPGGSTMLIDGGNNHAGDDVILPHFKDIHLRYLDYLVVSHPHTDHMGGLDEVVQELTYLEEFWTNGDTSTTWQWDDLTDAIDDQDADWVTVSRGFLETIDGCTVEVISPDHDFGDLNKNSIVMIIECEDVFVMFTGDATKQTEDDLINDLGFELASDIVKMPHHGSPDRASAFPSYVLPDYAIISCGVDNPYGHPSPETVQEWEDVGAAIYRTDLQGTITVSVKNGAISVSTED